MEIIKPNHIEEEKATLSKEDFIISEEPKLEKKFNPFKISSWVDLHWKYWTIIGLSIPLAISVITIFICRASKPYTATAPAPLQVTNTNNIRTQSSNNMEPPAQAAISPPPPVQPPYNTGPQAEHDPPR